MLTSTALVLLMSVPALALFYGGLVRSKNMLSVLMQVFVSFSLITVLWCIYGYSFAFTTGNAFFGSTARLFLDGLFDSGDGHVRARRYVQQSHADVRDRVRRVPSDVRRDHVLPDPGIARRAHQVLGGAAVPRHLVHVRVHPRRAHGLVLGGSGRVHATQRLPRLPIATAGLIWSWGALDFAGGTVVHINAGVAGLVGAIVLGKRVGLGRESMPPHNLTMTMIGASMLWFGWFGFNAGSALEANGFAALAFMNTFLATACAVLSWTFAEWLLKGKPSMLGAASGAVAGLVAITPAAGNVGIPGAFVIGLAAGVVCLWGCTGLKKLIGADDSLDVFGVHGIGGILGALLTGVFNAPSLGGPGLVTDWVTVVDGLPRHRRAAADPGEGRRLGRRLDGGGLVRSASTS